MIKRYFKFLVLSLASFFMLIAASLVSTNNISKISALTSSRIGFGFYIWGFPCIFIIISGILMLNAVYVKGQNKKEIKVLAVLSLVIGASIALFTVLVFYMVILKSTMFAMYWSNCGGRASMVLAGAFLGNSYRNYKEFKSSIE